MRIWFPVIRAGSGSDVYIQRLVAGLQARGVDACLQWFDRRYEFFPHLLRRVDPPSGTRIIHANSWNGFAFFRPRMPLIVTAFHCVYRCGYPGWKSLGQALYHDHWIGHYERRSFSCAEACVALTPSAVMDFETRFQLPPFEIIHGWVDVERFKPIDGPPSWPRKGGRILIVGNNSKRKGMDLLPKLRAALGLDFSIHVVGGLRARGAAECPGISFLSGLSEEDLVSEYRRADIVVSLSRHEGFGYTILEAMACAKPIVAFDVTGVRDIVEDGVTGFLVDVGDIDKLARRCQLIASDHDMAMRMGRLGRDLTVHRFSQESAIRSYLNLYEHIASDAFRPKS